MKRACFKAKEFGEAERYDILQYIRLSSDERQRIARSLKEKAYGKNPRDVRETKVVRRI